STGYYIVLLILLFHIFVTAHAFYSLFGEYQGWTLHHFYPFQLLLFTLAWLGVFLKQRWCAFAYVILLFHELAMKLFFGGTEFGEAFGKSMFPFDLAFVMVLLVLYKQIFPSKDASPS
ncbi:MAG TPA: hypothetical protein PLP34_02195, partial [Chitinophagaceae bacterium]|nr:hypothetical protein [Chitinophagaceae bacterium]